MVMKKLIALIVCSIASSAAAIDSQVSILLGPALSVNASDIHGLHNNGSGPEETEVSGVELNQNVSIGLNGRVYFNKYFGIDGDFLYSPIKFPEQTVIVNGTPDNQPSSNLDTFAFSIGPTIRYKGSGLWEKLNPYATVGFTYITGSASDVNLSPYGQGGSSKLDGTGYNLRFGAQYQWNKAILSFEYRYENSDIEIDHFRSFQWGLELNKSSSYLLLSYGITF